MTALIIILSILAVITLLLLLSPKVRVTFKDGLVLKAGVGPVMIKIISPDKKKKKIKLRDFSQKKYLKKIAGLKKQKSAPKKKKKAAHVEKPKGSVTDMVELVLEIVSRLEKYFGRIGTRVSRLRITVGGNDTADAAIKYGAACQAVAYLTEILKTKTRLRVGRGDEISVTCDYFSSDIKIDADIEIRIRVLDALVTGVDVLLLKLRHDEKISARNLNENSERQEIKNGSK